MCTLIAILALILSLPPLEEQQLNTCELATVLTRVQVFHLTDYNPVCLACLDAHDGPVYHVGWVVVPPSVINKGFERRKVAITTGSDDATAKVRLSPDLSAESVRVTFSSI